MFVGVELAEQVEGHVDHLFRAGAGTVNLIDDHDRFMAQVEGLFKHETSLRHGAVKGVDQQQYRVDHLQYSLHFSAEVGVARCVDYVDLQITVGNGEVLGQNRNATLFFKIVAVHDAFGDGLVFTKDA